MKTALTIEQSAELIKRGISIDKASECEDGDFRDIPVFALTDLLSLLPKGDGNDSVLSISGHNDKWNVAYEMPDSNDDYIYCVKETACVFVRAELIDALYAALLWCLDNHVKLD